MPPAILNRLLCGYDENLRYYLVSGFAHGFHTGCVDLSPGDAAQNLPSCDQAPEIIDRYITTELQAGRLAGPFSHPCPSVVKISPIGLIPKKNPGEFRVIHHLSFPYGDSVNDHMPRAHTAVQYGSIDEAVSSLSKIADPFLAKTDIVNAFRIIPMAAADTAFLGLRWRDMIYTDQALPMGLGSSSHIFQTFSDALVWIAQDKFGAGQIISVLDDFLFIGESFQKCQESLTGFEAMCKTLNVPLHPSKTVRPCQSLQFLGIELDTAAQVMRLPRDKIEKAQTTVNGLLRRRKAPLREIQACIGLLNFACHAVPLGRPFLRRLSDICIGVRRPHHRVSITRASRLDLQAWSLFLAHFNGRSMMDQRRWHSSPGLVLETDAAGGGGIGAICGRHWLHGTWPQWLCDVDISVKELIAIVVPIDVWSDAFANRCVLIRSDNSAVVAEINAQSSRSPMAMQWLRYLFLISVRYNILVRAQHIPGVQNAAPDALSRGLIQVFRDLRPDAASRPTTWDWDAFNMLRPRRRSCRRR